MNLENIRRHEMDIEEEQQTPDSLPENYSEMMSDGSLGGSKMTTGEEEMWYTIDCLLILIAALLKHTWHPEKAL